MTSSLFTPRRRALQLTAGGIAALLTAPLRAQRLPAATAVEVWKDASCGCCHDWIAHMEQHGFKVTAHDTGNNAVRVRLGLAARYGSCHTALVGGYVIEGHVAAAEMRRLLREVLAEHGAADVRVVEADALEVDWDELLGGAASWALVANLPYNVAVPIIMSVLERAPMVRRLVVMVQKEVAERLVASPGGRTVGIPSMRVAWYAEAELLGTVPPEVFVPRPRVTSALVGMTRREPPTRALGPD